MYNSEKNAEWAREVGCSDGKLLGPHPTEQSEEDCDIYKDTDTEEEKTEVFVEPKEMNLNATLYSK